MITMNDKQKAELERVEQALADRGIFPMYGGRKGHGFWLYRMDPHMAHSLLENFNPAIWADHVQGASITNDGKRSGNPYFWMFADARKLADAEVNQEAVQDGAQVQQERHRQQDHLAGPG